MFSNTCPTWHHLIVSIHEKKKWILKKPLFFDIRVDWKQFSARSYHTNLIVMFHCLEPVAGRHLLLPSLLGVGGEGVHRSLSDKYTLEPSFYWKKNKPRPWSSTKGISVNYSCWTSINTHFCRYHAPLLLTVKPNQAAAHKLLCAFPNSNTFSPSLCEPLKSFVCRRVS